MRLVLKVGMVVMVGVALLPAMVSAAPPTPEGKLVYEDDFSSAKSGLEDNLNAKDYSRGFHPPGVYHFMSYQNNSSNISLLPNLSLGQFSLQIDLWDNSDAFVGDVAQGMAFRAKDAEHMYSVLLDPRNGEYAVRKLNGKDTWSDLIAFKASPLVKQQAEVNTLRIDGNGDTFTIYLNNELLDTVKDSSYSTGRLGLLVSSVDATDPHMHFDNLKIYSTEQVTLAPAGLPQSGAANSSALVLLLACGCALLLGVGLRQRSYKA